MLSRDIKLVFVFIVLTFSNVTARCGRRSGDCKERTGPVKLNGLGEDNENGLTTPGGKPKKRKACCPYDFDSTNCKNIDDRVLCGYNRNGDWPPSKDEVRELAEGCRLRNGRLECGYIDPPYINPRRPPPWDKEAADNAYNDGNLVDNKDVSEYVEKVDDNERLTQEKQKTKEVKGGGRQQRNCVEINDRIVCKLIR